MVPCAPDSKKKLLDVVSIGMIDTVSRSEQVDWILFKIDNSCLNNYFTPCWTLGMVI